jgi:hypothetical protein
MSSSIRYAAIIAIWFFWVWIGFYSIETHDNDLLTLYVFAGSTAATMAIATIWPASTPQPKPQLPIDPAKQEIDEANLQRRRQQQIASTGTSASGRSKEE